MRKLKRPGAVMGIFALGLEATGVASGAYVYGDFPLKILGVPLCIPVMWVQNEALYLNVRYQGEEHVVEKLFLIDDPDLATEAHELMVEAWSEI